MSHCTISRFELVIMGDVNLHLENSTLQNTHKFNNILDGSRLLQHIYEPSHYSRHTLDVVISRETNTILTDVKVHDIGLCNNDGLSIRYHYAITATMKHVILNISRSLFNILIRVHKHIVLL